MSTQSSTASILHLHQIHKSYGDSLAVDGVSLTLQPGEILALLGPSGCGKTTLLRLMGGFERPDQGTVALGGQVVAGPSAWVPPEQRSVGMVFQNFALFPHLTVEKNVAFGLRGAGAGDRLQAALQLVGLGGFAQRYPHELSGGQQQRVALARALAPQPKVILLDEPLSSLDVQVRLHLRQEVRRILKATGISAVFVTHDQEEALSLADRVGVMREGTLEQVGTPEDLYRHPASQFVAEFVTQANFLPARLEGTTWVTPVGQFPVPPGVTAQAGTLMVRQEDLHLIPQEAGMVVVGDRQFLGREYTYRLDAPSAPSLYARTPSNVPPLALGTPVQLQVAAAALTLFPA